MKKIAMLAAILLALSLVVSGPVLAAVNPDAPAGTKGQAKYDGDYRVVRIASWYDYQDMYFSGMNIDDIDAYFTTPESMEKRFERLHEIEEEYKVKFEFVRTTYDGAQISIDEGVLSGRPEADIYEVDINFAMTYALNGYCYALDDLVLPDDDVFTTQQVFLPLKFPSQDETYLWSVYNDRATVYLLGFNWTMLEAKGLENPQDLYERGEWTWDVFLDYCTKLTDLTAATPVYGYTGLWTNNLNGFLRSNGAQIAGTKEGGLMTAATGEVLDMFKKLYVDLKVARPWNPDTWEVNNLYSDSSAAFFTAADWILNSDNVNYGGGMDHPLNFEIGVVPFPIGPSGNQATNTHNAVTGNYYIIPKGVENPAQAFAAYEALRNWYDGDFENTKQYDILDPDEVPLNWSEEVVYAAAHGNEELADKNVKVVDLTMRSVSFDPWESLMYVAVADTTGNFSMWPIMDSQVTPAQFQETYRQPMENALKTVYK